MYTANRPTSKQQSMNDFVSNFLSTKTGGHMTSAFAPPPGESWV